ncbi:MAG: hypothetical protein EB005_02560 [Actinobacteria bacterium]|nr:hypothetical protein [Actinomycetota bacterium]
MAGTNPLSLSRDIAIDLGTANTLIYIKGEGIVLNEPSAVGIVTASSCRVAGDEINDAIVAMFKKEFNLDVGDNTAEDVKIQLGSAWPLAEELTADVGGRDVTTGLPRTQEVTTVEIRAAIDGPVSAIIDIVKSTLERTPPELAADVISNGITLSGGGALLTGLTERMIHETGIQTVVADDPLMSVVIGGGLTLENLDAMKGLTAQSDDE